MRKAQTVSTVKRKSHDVDLDLPYLKSNEIPGVDRPSDCWEAATPVAERTGTVRPCASDARRWYSVGAVTPETFDRAAADFDDLCIDQVAVFKEEEQPGRTSLFLSYRDGEVAAAAVVVLYTLPMVGRGIAHVRFGPVWRRRGQAADPANYRAIVRQLIKEFSTIRGLMLTILPRPHPDFSEIESAMLRSTGFDQRPPAAQSCRYLVDLDPSPREQRQSLAQKWRYNLKKSEKTGVTVAREEGVCALDAFAGIHGKMLTRKQVSLADRLDIVERLAGTGCDRLKPRIYLARNGGDVVAGAIVLGFGDTAHYLYGATDDAGLELRAGYLLQWHIVSALSTESFRFYDLGGSSRNAGLRQFKAGLSGRAGLTVDIPCEHDYASNRLISLCGQSLHLLRYMKNGGNQAGHKVDQAANA